MTNQEIMSVVKPAVCAQLKSPASALFPVDMISIVGDDMRGYRVEGFVDSQNSYGAMIRTDFSATVGVENGFPVVRSAVVGKKAATQSAKNFGASYLVALLLTAVGGAFFYFIIKMMVGF